MFEKCLMEPTNTATVTAQVEPTPAGPELVGLSLPTCNISHIDPVAFREQVDADINRFKPDGIEIFVVKQL